MLTVSPRFDVDAPLPRLGELGRTHFVAIGGSGMSAVARLLLERGVEVSGSDAADSAALAALRAAGATVWVGHDPVHVEGASTLVVSSAIKDDNVELAAGRAAGAIVLHRAQALAVATQGSEPVAVAGANGKTTTSAMLAVALTEAGVDPSFAVGALVPDLGTNARVGTGAPFVVEADESDGSFLVYHPSVAVVTNVQPDHLDFYGTYDQVREAYAAFAATVRPGGLLVACHDDAGSLELARRARAAGQRVLSYGLAAEADLRVVHSSPEGVGSRSRILVGGTERDLVLRVPGEHNVANAAAAYLAAVEGCGADADLVLAGLARFAGAQRRFELHGEVGGISVVDDYAHNPGKVAAVVGTAARVAAHGGGRLHVVFQPHLYSRTRDFAVEFAAGLAPAHHVVLLDVYGAREQPFDGISSELIAAPLRALPGERVVRCGGSFDDALHAVVADARAGDLVLTVGAGDVTTLAPRLVAALRQGSGQA